MGKQICSRCRVEKPFSEYHKNPRYRGGVNVVCRECDNRRRRNWYRNQEPVEKTIRILATGILKRTNSKEGYYYNKGIENRLGENRAEVMDYLRNHFADDIQAMLDRGEQVTVDRINSAGHYEEGNIRIMEFMENSLRGSMTSRKLASYALIIEDLETGNIAKVPSEREAARAIECSRSAIRSYLKRNNPSPIYGRYKITREE